MVGFQQFSEYFLLAFSNPPPPTQPRQGTVAEHSWDFKYVASLHGTCSIKASRLDLSDYFSEQLCWSAVL